MLEFTAGAVGNVVFPCFTEPDRLLQQAIGILSRWALVHPPDRVNYLTQVVVSSGLTDEFQNRIENMDMSHAHRNKQLGQTT